MSASPATLKKYQPRSLWLALLLFLPSAYSSAEAYQPLFSNEMLQSLDPATRERFAELENENKRRWRNRNPQKPDIEAAQRRHAETQAMLQRFEESRRLEQAAAARQTERSLEQQQRCAVVASEIENLSAGGSFYETLDDGQRRYLSDNEVAERVKFQQKSYNKHCKGL